MLSDAEILEDLGQLKDIVESHKAPDAPLSVGSAIINEHELPVFTKAPANLCELYRIGLADADQDFWSMKRRDTALAKPSLPRANWRDSCRNNTAFRQGIASLSVAGIRQSGALPIWRSQCSERLLCP